MDTIKLTELLINLNEIKLIAVMIFVTVLVLGVLILLKPLLKDILTIVIGKIFKNGKNHIKKRD
ncbi:holin BlyA [Borreliella burgdorferi]|uniref:holin BlyA n=1 Tax=Borreliella burgdorferi TaxID=139 RepID=UPI000D034CB7|nr:holin BlyA [Borreliella burgdorferi]PRQ90817.1 holin, BlyA family [Borreliella burgdorferi]PRR26010.1 holin, BlyA family [Borreliella burgdorferi]PRR37973.1 holin, BlyA family [Borreliella burgdorferi]